MDTYRCMQKLFNNILVPVTLDSTAGATIEEAIEFANQFHCNLHLVGITEQSSLKLRDRLFQLIKETEKKAENKKKLAELQTRYCQKLTKGLVLSAYFEPGDPEDIIATYVGVHQIDLVFVVKEGKRFFGKQNGVNANRMAGKTNCPVLSFNASLGIDGLKIIVMPVGNSLPINKIRVAAYLAKHCKSSIHLVTRERDGLMYEELAYMQKALQILKDNTDLQVECKTLSGESIANIALEYAHSVNAGMIIVNSGESFLPGMVNRFFSRLVCNQSRIPVMTVA